MSLLKLSAVVILGITIAVVGSMRTAKTHANSAAMINSLSSPLHNASAAGAGYREIDDGRTLQLSTTDKNCLTLKIVSDGGSCPSGLACDSCGASCHAQLMPGAFSPSPNRKQQASEKVMSAWVGHTPVVAEPPPRWS